LGRTVFYLDDDPQQLDLFRGLFGRDYAVRTSSGASDALRSLAVCPADVIVCDYLAAGLQGTDFLRAAAELCPGAVRVLLSGVAGLGEVYPHVSSGAVHLFVVKPWTEEQMREAMERAAAMLDGRIRGEAT
jgi:DNA-binding NtrC family response regulator